MKTRFSLLCALMLFSGCTGPCGSREGAFAPEEVAGRTIHATLMQGTGSFAQMPIGYTFDTTLNADQSFKTLTTEKTLDSQGTYTYKKRDDNIAVLSLTDASDLHKRESIEVTLVFTSDKTGTYSVKVINAQAGEQSGTFELR